MIAKDFGFSQEIPKTVIERLEKDLAIYDEEGLDSKALEIKWLDGGSIADHVGKAVDDYRWANDFPLFARHAAENLSAWFEICRVRGLLRSEGTTSKLKGCMERCAELEQRCSELEKEKLSIAKDRDYWKDEAEKPNKRRPPLYDERVGHSEFSNVQEDDDSN